MGFPIPRIRPTEMHKSFLEIEILMSVVVGGNDVCIPLSYAAA